MRIGNGAYKQNQHDVWGAMLDSIYLHTKSRDQLPDRLWPIIKHQVETALDRWREPDYGIWEVRGEPRHFTSSKLMCWVAARPWGAPGSPSPRPANGGAVGRRSQPRSTPISATHALDHRGVFVQHYDTTALDASLLLMPLVRFLPASDPRIIAHGARRSRMSSPRKGWSIAIESTTPTTASPADEGTFTICSFWLVSALCEIGEVERARRLCEKLLSYASPLQLYAEEIDPETGRHLGNFPQAFTHLALINAVMHVISAEQLFEQGQIAALASRQIAKRNRSASC